MDGRYLLALAFDGGQSADEFRSSGSCGVRSYLGRLHGELLSHQGGKDTMLMRHRGCHRNGASCSLRRLSPRRKLPDIRKRCWMFSKSIRSNNWALARETTNLHRYRQCRLYLGRIVALRLGSRESVSQVNSKDSGIASGRGKGRARKSERRHSLDRRRQR